MSKFCAYMVNYKENDEPSNDRRLGVIIERSSQFYVVREGVLYHVVRNRKSNRPDTGPARMEQLIVPQDLQQTLIAAYHSGSCAGYLSYDKMFQTISRKYFWRSCNDDIRTYCANCLICTQLNEGGRRKAKLHLKEVTGPFQRIEVDFEGPLTETEKGNR